MIRCILFDRDGTLGYLDDHRFPQTFHPFCPIREVFDRLKAQGYTVGIITNQSSIARGTGAGYDFEKEFQSYGADIWVLCPHDDSDNCECRKPKSGLLIAAAEKLGLAFEEILVVGDRLTDIQCAKNVGANAALVLTGRGRDELKLAKTLYPDLTVIDRFDQIR